MADEWIVTEFELGEQVFVPAGDGAPAQWKMKGDLTVAEFARHAQELRTAAALQMERAERYATLVEKVASLGPRGLSDEEIRELKTLKMTLDAQERKQDRRQAAIDRDKAARGFWTLPLRPDPPA
jgi:hypothetical protein